MPHSTVAAPAAHFYVAPEMSQPDLDNNRRRPTGEHRAYGALRTALIGYGVVAYSLLHLRQGSGVATQALGNLGSAPGVVLSGLGLQLFLIVARALIKRYAPDSASATQGMSILGTIADGVTVLLFAMATLGAITQAPGNI